MTAAQPAHRAAAISSLDLPEALDTEHHVLFDPAGHGGVVVVNEPAHRPRIDAALGPPGAARLGTSSRFSVPSPCALGAFTESGPPLPGTGGRNITAWT
jgi:hypothetical protein